jgi:hypothetical protein
MLRPRADPVNIAGVELSDVIVIERPVEVVFDAWAQLDRSVEYDRRARERRVVGNEATGSGTRVLAVDRWPGFDLDYKIVISAYRRPDRIAATVSEPLSGGWDAIFESHPRGTEMRLETTLSPGGLLGLLLPFLRPWVRRRHRTRLESFRSWLESETEAA